MEQRLSAEQQNLVAEHHDMIYKILGRYELPVSEYYDIAAIALCNAAYAWVDDGSAKFQTFASRCICNAVTDEVKKQSRKKRTALKRVPLYPLANVGTREFDPDFYAELGLFDELKHKI